MVLEYVEDDLFKKHQELCRKLNLDPSTISQAWGSFSSIRSNYTLEGDPSHWLGCAIFVACRETTTPTVGQALVEGNCVNLTSLLRYCNLSLAQFFNKIKKWSDMANINEEFKQKIGHLEGNFAVSFNVFKEYVVAFTKIFKSPTDVEQTKSHRNRKQRAVPCNPARVFEFIWHLFVTLKGQYLSCSDDLVTSVHLVFACCDLAFKNAFLANRRDLFNPEFNGLPLNWSDPDYVVPEEAPCIMDKICGTNSSMETEAKYMKTYHCKSFLMSLFNNGTLQGNENDFTGLFDPAVFDANYKNVNRTYEAHLLNKGDFDERIFLAEYRRRTLMKEQASLNYSILGSPFAGDAVITGSPKNYQYGEIVQQPPATPLTGRRYLGPRDQNEVTPLSTATQSVAQLQSMLNGRHAAPSEELTKIFQSCARDPTEMIQQLVTKLGDKFVAAYTQQAMEIPDVQIDYVNKRLQLAIKLFYKFIENILQNEKTIRKDISGLVEKEIFYECVLLSSLEIVIYSHNSQKKFPWILTALDIQPYNFVKVIELIVRSKDQLSRDVVKHLNLIEETVIESLAWQTNSQLWEDIRKSAQEIPKFEEIALPGSVVRSEIRPVTSNSENVLQSPGPSAVDRFQSPITNTPVKKQLFPVNKTSTHLMVTDKDGCKRLIPLPESEPTPQPNSAVPSRPRKTSGLAIFFRKFYNLAGVRMDDLCSQLNITDLEFKQKIWTVFEYSIRCKTDLMRDRHLDQLLMCALYAVCKVSGNAGINFTEIMRCYRKQPQADSHIYRSVLMRPARTENSSAGNQNIEFSQRGDLINFYNSIYVDVMRDLILQFARNVSPDILLSPLPVPKSNLVSPKHEIVKNVFVMPYESPNTALNGSKTLNYFFSRSPSKDLKDINRAINGVSGKRLLVDGDSDMPNKRIPPRKVQCLIEDRKSQNME